MLANGMFRSSTISSWPASNVMVRCWHGSSVRPLKTSAYMRATRLGVLTSPSRSGSSPIASRISRTAFSMRPSSISLTTIGPLMDTTTPYAADLCPSGGLGLGARRTPAGRSGGLAVATGLAVGARPRRQMADDLHQLRRVERLLLDQRGGQLVEHGPVGRQDRAGRGVGSVDEAADLAVDAGRDLVGVVRLVAVVAPEEDLGLLRAELLRT